MTSVLWAVFATLVLAMVQVGVQSVVTLRQAGGAWVAGPRDRPFHVTGVSGRLVRAHRNLLEIIPQFFAAVFLVHLAGEPSRISDYGAWIFVVSRVLYVPAYAWGPIGLRPLCWQGGQTGILVVLADLFA
ncbi:MAG: MAPEG family protein [Pseudomonadota bacterium]